MYTVDQKYLTPTQIVEVSYEGRSRWFAVAAVTAEGNDSQEDLAAGLAALSVSDKKLHPCLWTVDWNVTVQLEHEDGEKDGKPADKTVCSSYMCIEIASLKASFLVVTG